eukprot:gnl/TRDRNA2_/TRDRNA2_44462_c0_seq1.p1 gnl/TRDRNA2_/TRDRNA2_44462_c0~~gnl/TRDRNA2_/TRDRNA2_44462_c0_seq1.p1  ORF type:complete len:248 (+),score=19.77 gnl/TRDRNA2_/TRDRNA2_44462_c0_seq1:68-745(+)
MGGGNDLVNMNNLSHVKSAPKFSIYGKYEYKPLEVKPAPGQYGLVDTGKYKYARDTTSAFGNAPKPSSGRHSVPGPGAYGVPKDPSHRNTAAWSMGSEPRLHERKRAVTPGPGAYDRHKGVEGCSYSVASKPEGMRPATAPGPGQYGNPADPSLKSSPKFSLASSVRPKESYNKTPGPGTYKQLECLGGNFCMRSSPKFSIGGATRRDLFGSGGNSIGCLYTCFA